MTEASLNDLDNIYKIFWDFFVENKAYIETIGDDPQGVYSNVQQVFDAVAPGLEFEIGYGSSGNFEFIIIAGGMQENIQAVVDMYNSAPEIDGWAIIPFRPRQELGPIDMGGIVYDPSDFYYSSSVENGYTCVKVFIKDYTPEREQELGGLVFMLLDTALGEFDVMTKVGMVELDAMPLNPIESGLRPLASLAEEIDQRYPHDA